MIYLYQQTEKGEQMICDSREKGGKTTQNKGEKDSENSMKRGSVNFKNCIINGTLNEMVINIKMFVALGYSRNFNNGSCRFGINLYRDNIIRW